METLSQFKKSMNVVGSIDFMKASTGRQIATVSTLSNNGQRVKATIIKAKNYDIKNPNKFVVELEDSPMVFVLCNAKLTAGDAE